MAAAMLPAVRYLFDSAFCNMHRDAQIYTCFIQQGASYGRRILWRLQRRSETSLRRWPAKPYD